MAGLTQGVAISRRVEECTEEFVPQGGPVGLGARPRGDQPGPRMHQLVRTIESEIIPRLMLAWRPPPGASCHSRDRVVPCSGDVEAFAKLVLAHDTGMAHSFIGTLRDRGVSLETICLNLLAPTARYLGDLWVEDLCDFSEVTLGLCCLHQVLREFSGDFQSESELRETDQRVCGRRALLMPVPGEQHSFGLMMVSEFFRRSGWDVRGGPVSSSDEMADQVRGEWFAVVGLSLSCERHLEALTSGISTIRRCSRNRNIGVMVGGALFVEHPELVARVGADATASDGRQAAMQAENLLALLLRC